MTPEDELADGGGRRRVSFGLLLAVLGLVLVLATPVALASGCNGLTGLGISFLGAATALFGGSVAIVSG